MKVLLIHPKGGSKLSSSGVLPPLGILSIATYLKQKLPEVEVEIFDEETDLPQPDINCDILGLSVTGANYERAIEYAEKAKNKDTLVVLGGPHATVKHIQILKRQRCVDAVVRGDGEMPFYQCLRSILRQDYPALSKIMGLSYRNLNGGIVMNLPAMQYEQMDLNTLPAPDFQLLGELQTIYKENFQSHHYRQQGFTRFISLESQKGCAKSVRSGRCTFCARLDVGLRRMEPREFWRRIQGIMDPDGRTVIFDLSDSFPGKLTKGDNWLNKLVELKPQHLENRVYFKIFARSDELNEEVVRLLKRLGVFEVFLGVESGDSKLLQKANKCMGTSENMKAVTNLKRYGINGYLSLVYGLPGESQKSLQRTQSHVKELIEIGNITAIGARVLFPLAGSVDHNRLLAVIRRGGNSDLAEKIETLDWYPPGELQRLWVRYMTKTSLEEIREAHRKIMKLAGSYGIRINEEKRLLL